MQLTQKRIIEYLQEFHAATAQELHRPLDMTMANIRHHLTLLEKEGKLEVIGQTEPEGRGRPEYIYMLTRTTTPSGLPDLAKALFEDIKAEKDTRTRNKRYKHIATLLQTEAATSPSPLTIRLTESVQRLNELQYQAHWEAQSEGPLVVLGNCPYAQIIDEHPELCQIDQHLIENMTGKKVNQEEKGTRTLDGSKVCKFRLIA